MNLVLVFQFCWLGAAVSGVGGFGWAVAHGVARGEASVGVLLAGALLPPVLVVGGLAGTLTLATVVLPLVRYALSRGVTTLSRCVSPSAGPAETARREKLEAERWARLPAGRLARTQCVIQSGMLDGDSARSAADILSDAMPPRVIALPKDQQSRFWAYRGPAYSFTILRAAARVALGATARMLGMRAATADCALACAPTDYVLGYMFQHMLGVRLIVRDPASGLFVADMRAEAALLGPNCDPVAICDFPRVELRLAPAPAPGLAPVLLPVRITGCSGRGACADGNAVAWAIAKAHAAAAFMQASTFQLHVRMHLILEAFAVATARHLLPANAVRQLLMPHLDAVVITNDNAMLGFNYSPVFSGHDEHVVFAGATTVSPDSVHNRFTLMIPAVTLRLAHEWDWLGSAFDGTSGVHMDASMSVYATQVVMLRKATTAFAHAAVNEWRANGLDMAALCASSEMRAWADELASALGPNMPNGAALQEPGAEHALAVALGRVLFIAACHGIDHQGMEPLLDVLNPHSSFVCRASIPRTDAEAEHAAHQPLCWPVDRAGNAMMGAYLGYAQHPLAALVPGLEAAFEPAFVTARHAPAVSSALDDELVADILRCDEAARALLPSAMRRYVVSLATVRAGIVY